MSACIITAEIFDAFLKCESKAYFESSGQIGEPDELVNWQREIRQEFRRSRQSRYRPIFLDAFDAPQPSFLDELKSGKHHILLDCRLEAGQFQSRIDAVEKVTRLTRTRSRGYIPIRFVPDRIASPSVRTPSLARSAANRMCSTMKHDAPPLSKVTVLPEGKEV